MKKITTIICFVGVSLIYCMTALCQGESAVPFLLIGSSPEGNGMGGSSATTPTTDALATISNPGQLGLFSLRDEFNAGTFAPRTDWLPQFGIRGLNYGATAINAGYNFAELLSLPFSLSAGLGYSRTSINLGTFVVTMPGSPTFLGTFNSNESSEAFSAAIGVEYFARLGIGFNFKRIESNLSPTGIGQPAGTGSAHAPATDFGLLLDVPIAGIISEIAQTRLEIATDISPFLDLSFAYVESNVGGTIVYADAAQPDPLPRTVTAGLSFEVGLHSTAGSSHWKLASFRLARQADDLLVVRKPDGSFDYQSGLGDIQFVDNVILGKLNPRAAIRKGWQLQVAEVFYLRRGSSDNQGLAYSTSGYSICLAGFLKLLGTVSPELGKDSWIGFAAEHFDLQYHSSKYEGTGSPILGTTFASLNLVVRGFEL